MPCPLTHRKFNNISRYLNTSKTSTEHDRFLKKSERSESVWPALNSRLERDLVGTDRLQKAPKKANHLLESRSSDGNHGGETEKRRTEKDCTRWLFGQRECLPNDVKRQTLLIPTPIHTLYSLRRRST